MSSPLDGRIRKLAREEAASMFATPETATAADFNVDRVAELQQQITDLHEHLHVVATTIDRLGKRIDALEAAAGPVNADAPGGAPRPRARRTSREASAPE
ncbi:MAG TPA: hypothetical protein VGA66_05605 [Mycobacterium sp.]